MATPRPSTPAGLCERCAWMQEVVSGRGSRFVRCGRSAEDARFPRYPPLPVLRCVGFEVASETRSE